MGPSETKGNVRCDNAEALWRPIDSFFKKSISNAEAIHGPKSLASANKWRPIQVEAESKYAIVSVGLGGCRFRLDCLDISNVML